MPVGKPFESKFDNLVIKDEILEYARKTTPYKAAEKYYVAAEMSKMGLFKAIDKVVFPQKKEMRKKLEGSELTEEEGQLLIKFKDGQIGYEEVQRILATKIFEKILKNPDSLQIRDWLQSEMIKMKKDETTRQKDALEKFINALFGGFVPPLTCPHCGRPTVIRTERLGELDHGHNAELSED